MTKAQKPITYQEAGVSIDTGNEFVQRIKPHIKSTARAEVMAPLGGYAGLFKLDLKKYPDPVLVSTTDGVGTKLKLAFELNKFDTVGIDLIAMCVNDLICCGAEPLFFLDYYASGKLELECAVEVIKGMTDALSKINCTLIGGETAEMPGMYQKGEFDLAGFSVGVVNRDKIVDGSRIREGDILIGVASSGVHSNGFSLVRKILEANQIDLTKDTCGLSQPIGRELLTPTHIYVNPVLRLLEQNLLNGLAHITGGGLVENVPRILPANLTARFERSKINILPIFSLLQKLGNVPDAEMWRVFNMGVGLVLAVSPQNEKAALDILGELNFKANVIGEVIPRKPQGEGVLLDG